MKPAYGMNGTHCAMCNGDNPKGVWCDKCWFKVRWLDALNWHKGSIDMDIRIKFEEMLESLRVIGMPKRGTGEEHMTTDEVYAFATKKYQDYRSWYDEFTKINP